MGKLADAVANGDKRAVLLALRDEIARTIESTTSGRDVAALSKRLIETIDAIEALPGVGGSNPVDALAAAIAEFEGEDDAERDDDG